MPDSVECPYCASDPGCCCRALAKLREKKRAKDRAAYIRHQDTRRAKNLAWYHAHKAPAKD